MSELTQTSITDLPEYQRKYMKEILVQVLLGGDMKTSRMISLVGLSMVEYLNKENQRKVKDD